MEKSGEEEHSGKKGHQDKGPSKGRSLEGTRGSEPGRDTQETMRGPVRPHGGMTLLLEQWEALESSRQGCERIRLKV